ncbi:MIF4G like-domain-containing protein, partial [Plectosphaerella plurivora]
MADYDRRRQGGGGYNNRKRRYRDDDDDYRRGSYQRRNDPPPVHVRLRKQLLTLAESPLRRGHEEAQAIGQLVGTAEEPEAREVFINTALQLVVEQPLKTPFVAAVIQVANAYKPDIAEEILAKLSASIESQIQAGQWRDVKLNLKLVACLQSCLLGEGIFPLLEALFERAVQLQTASSEDTIGTELVKIILLTIPYAVVTGPEKWSQKAAELLDKTDIIASEPHALQDLIDPYLPENKDESTGSQSVIGLLQKQLQGEAGAGWPLMCLPRPWQMPLEELEAQEKLDAATKHELPAITLPEKVPAGPRPLFPEVYFSVYSNGDIESVPPVTDIASSLLRDAAVDTINILDFNRHATAGFLINLDCYFADTTFVKRATPFDRLRDIEQGKSTWKPEDVVVDAVFSQLHQLPAAEHKLVYYHALLTESCKQAPAAIAPSLGRAIRYLYSHAPRMDLELSQRFLDWFAHHLSNFGFTWKWSEWAKDVSLPDIHPRKALILGALDKEIRLSFAQRIKKTLPPDYDGIIGPEKEKDVPDFKFASDNAPFAAEGREIAALLKRKVPDEEFQPVIDRIQAAAAEHGLDPVVASTDVFVTAVCYVGSKSLSHVLACIERVKDRLMDIGAASEAGRVQIITSVMAYWDAQPGVAVTIVEKLLNYTILTPLSVVDWALVNHGEASGNNRGAALAQSHVYELVSNTVAKVTGRVRQVVGPDVELDEETKAADIKAMRDLFKALDDALVAWASGSKDEMLEGFDGAEEEGTLLREWGQRWLRVFRRKSGIEEAFLLEA